jgi:hypothetical protein
MHGTPTLSEGVATNFPHLFDKQARLAQAVAALKDAGARRIDDRRPDGAGPGRDVAFIGDYPRRG